MMICDDIVLGRIALNVVKDFFKLSFSSSTSTKVGFSIRNILDINASSSSLDRPMALAMPNNTGTVHLQTVSGRGIGCRENR